MVADRYDNALAGLIAFLKSHSYRFVTPTPATHAHVLTRAGTRMASDLRDMFGWSMPFAARLLDRAVLEQLQSIGMVEETIAGFKSRLRVSSLGADLFLHGAYPTSGTDAVFFGPDSYRFARLIEQQLASCPGRAVSTVVDIGTGAGVGAVVAAHLCPAAEIVMTDINPAALRLAAINARAAGVAASGVLAGDLASLAGKFDLVLANPPYIIDDAGRAYRDGGGMHGAAVSLDMAREAVPRLAPGGRFILYTGSAIVGGHDAVYENLRAIAKSDGCSLAYAEIDPDVFGEELQTENYRDVERIALISAVIERPEAGA